MRIHLLVLSVMATLPAFSQSEEDAVKQVITTAYVGGIHNGGPVSDIRAGFHPGFNMLRLIKNEVSPLPIEEWIKNIEKSRSENPNATRSRVDSKFINVAVVGNSANVTLELWREEKKIFTDHLLLYKFDEGWRIVSKSFFRHPQ